MSEQKVFVVMGNDFPDSVFATEAAAESYVADKDAAQKIPDPGRVSRRVYWRVYHFALKS